MSRTLGPVLTEQQSSHEIQEQKFYLNNQLPMFLAYNQNKITERSQAIDEDIAKCKQLIETLCDNQLKTKQSLEELQQNLNQQNDMSKGIGYFGAKNLVFLEYLMLLKLYQLYRINGKSLTTGDGLDLYKRLAYLKTLMLKLQPVQKKLQYQKNKILKNADRAVITKQKKQESQESQQQGSENIEQQNDQVEASKAKKQENASQEQIEEDQMAFKPRPNSLMKIKQQRDIRLSKNDKYEAPKVSSNLSKQQKMKQRMQKQKDRRRLGLIRRLQSDLITDDRAQQKYLGDELSERFKKKFQQKISYEEDAFVRIPDNKKEKFYKKQMIRNSLRKNQLEEDFKQVQMVRQLFDDENKMQNKIVGQKSKKNTGKKFNQKEQSNEPKRFKKISKK